MLNSKKVTLITLKCVLLFSANHKNNKKYIYFSEKSKKIKNALFFRAKYIKMK